MKRYHAPWGRALRLCSVLLVVVCLGLSAVLLWQSAAHGPSSPPWWLAVVPLVILFGALPFTIRGYTIAPDAILVHRLFWDTRLPRVGLESARVEPDAMRRSLRTFGNGGGFSFTGFYYHKRLGHFRAFVTDLHRTVVLRYAKRNIVVSPDEPDRFVSELAVPEDLRANASP